MTLAIIVQARWNSSRLPGKILEDLGGAPALKRCLDRCDQIPQSDVVVCAVPDTAENDPIAKAAASWGYVVSRGSEDDVLSRYAKAAREVDATTVMRVTSDCPMIDPKICDSVLSLLKRQGVGYACNNMPARFPHGLDCDAFSAEHLYEADKQANTQYDREHVTPWIRSKKGIKRASLQGPGEPLASLRWTLDYKEDLLFMQALYEAMGNRAATASAAEYARMCLMRPDIQSINEKHINRNRLALSEHAHIETSPVSLEIAA
ncbi:cytidylyltransferase domain-containing protein [Hirschia maritima]|uniref:cytidylyltransferase domain-containing protein n=1 Tax=Hirschia maritima TaxID=1121961 RepID=UPI0003743BC9|nr:glycosyltransferase family protein [Hirschia maritima]